MSLRDVLTSTDAERIIERAARFAAMPVSLHCVAGATSEKVIAFGQCAACRYVANVHGGAEACRASRAAAESACLDRKAIWPFICHMGFACVAVPVFEDYILTFGPFCPSEETRSLEQDALAGLHNLGHRDRHGQPHTQVPASLSDIRLVPAATVPEIARWAVEELLRLPTKPIEAAPESSEPSPDQGRPRPRRTSKADPHNAAAIAASLASESQEEARKLVYAALVETESGQRVKAPVRRARAVAIVAAVLEAAERAGLEAKACWDGFPRFLQELADADRETEQCATIMGVLGILKRKAVRNETVRQEYIELNEIVLSRITEPVTLNEVAAALGQTPTAITHRLQRKFGMSYSEYVGRLRIGKAKELLRRTGLSATEIGRRVGIADTSNFGKLFRKFEGMTPSEYRTKFGKKKTEK